MGVTQSQLLFGDVPMILRTRTAYVTLALVLALAAGIGARQPVAPHRAQLSLDLLAREARHSSRGARVIVGGTPAEIDAIAARHHLTIARRLAAGAVFIADSAAITELAADTAIDHLSGDLPVRSTMSVSDQSTGADQVHAGSPGLLGIGGLAGVTGQGISVAVIDSGISPHPALWGDLAASVSLVTGDASVADAFGHGTHIAGIITGSGAAAARVTPLYTGGIAPGAHVINVRVLGADGTGLTSDVIAGIDWAIANRSRYNIRVINLSLGHPVTEPAATDPLDEAVSRAVSAGIVVVAAAGNSGKTADGTPILGGITSPGNSPDAITVGALNTWQTVPRDDDSLTTYSSRGPTRYDLAVKPDVLAPGNKIVSLEADDSYLATTYAFLHRAGSVRQRLHAVERHEHGGRHGERWRRAPAAGQAGADAGAGEAGAADRRDLRAGRRADGRRRGQRQFPREPEDRFGRAV